MEPNRKIVIVEGPQGSGKTTYIRELVHRFADCAVVQAPNATSRFPTGDSVPFESMIWHFTKMTQAIQILRSSPEIKTVYIDRLSLSQYVYQTLRGQDMWSWQPADFFTANVIEPAVRDLDILFNAVVRMASIRSSQSSPRLADIDLEMVIFDLPMEEIYNRRGRSTDLDPSRTYPAGNGDILLYQYAAAQADWIRDFSQYLKNVETKSS